MKKHTNDELDYAVRHCPNGGNLDEWLDLHPMADLRAAEIAAAQQGVTLESISADLVADGYTPPAVALNAPVVLRRWVATTARNMATARHNAEAAAAPLDRIGCVACGDDVPARLTPRGYMCADCRARE